MAIGGSCLVLLAVVLATFFRFLRRMVFRKRPKLVPRNGWHSLVAVRHQTGSWIWFVLVSTMVIVFASFGTTRFRQLMSGTNTSTW